MSSHVSWNEKRIKFSVVMENYLMDLEDGLKEKKYERVSLVTNNINISLACTCVAYLLLTA